jgi:hypothetical protein
MRYSDNDERGHDPTPCSSSVCNWGKHDPFFGTAMPGFAWHLSAQYPVGMREDSNGYHRHNMGRRRILAVCGTPRSALRETDWCNSGKAEWSTNLIGTATFTLA